MRFSLSLHDPRVLGIVFFLVVGIVVMGIHTFSQDASGYRDDDSAYNTAYWTERIDTRGGAAAYQEFLERNGEAPQVRRHFAAHIMGELLYEKLGLSAIVTCDSNFGFGCYHGFFGRAIANEGPDIVGKLDALCIESFGPLGTGCQHGIGHGVLEYARGDVEKALILCGKTTQSAPLLGCASGVFMEYNTPLTTNADNPNPMPRSFNAADPYAPCDDVPNEYQASCFYELGNWLRFSQAEGIAGDVCRSVTNTHRDDCLLGIGNSLGVAMNNSPEDAIAYCSHYDASDALLCRAGASWSFWSSNKKVEAAQMCAYEDEAQTDTCLTHADLTQSVRGNRGL